MVVKFVTYSFIFVIFIAYAIYNVPPFGVFGNMLVHSSACVCESRHIHVSHVGSVHNPSCLLLELISSAWLTDNHPQGPACLCLPNVKSNSALPHPPVHRAQQLQFVHQALSWLRYWPSLSSIFHIGYMQWKINVTTVRNFPPLSKMDGLFS